MPKFDGTVSCVCPDEKACLDRDPVCGTDGLTYVSKCHLDHVACSKSVPIDVAYKGPCGGNDET